MRCEDGDANEYLAKHYMDFDFIWGITPIPALILYGDINESICDLG